MNITRLSTTMALALSSQCLFSQNSQIMSNNIATLQVVAGDNWLTIPIIELGGDEPINISFDDLTHEYRRYVYRLQHCEADWTPSEDIFDSDYCEGFADGNTIEDAIESINTNTLYTHYSMQIPNSKTRIKMSGNYLLNIYDENTQDTVAKICFMVVENIMGIKAEVSSNTDIDTNKSHQQVAWSVGYGNIKVTDPTREIKTVVMQNGSWRNAVTNVAPQFSTADGLTWTHCRQLIFDAGNEYHKFEILATTHPTLGIEEVCWDGSNYNARIWTDMPRTNYTYDEDANGAFYIRNSDNIENDYASEYINVLFRLKSPRQTGNVYVSGVWTNEATTPQYAMTYNEIDGQYEAMLKLKQGYYSYRYVVVDQNNRLQNAKPEGNFYQTENKYQILVYHRPVGGRTDKLVGYKEINFK